MTAVIVQTKWQGVEVGWNRFLISVSCASCLMKNKAKNFLMRADIFIYITSPSSSHFIYACTRVSSHVTEHSPFFAVLYKIFTEQVAWIGNAQ
jgi:hypothetical protein